MNSFVLTVSRGRVGLFLFLKDDEEMISVSAKNIFSGYHYPAYGIVIPLLLYLCHFIFMKYNHT